MNLKYKLKNFFFPRTHSYEVKAILYCRRQLKLINQEMAKMQSLAQIGYWGDSLWDRWHSLTYTKKYREDEIKKLKQQYVDSKK